MVNIVAMRLYQMLGILEKSHGLTVYDGLHRQVLNAVIDAHVAGHNITNQDIVDLGFTSRSSTYRKIGELKFGGFLADEWNQGICNLKLGPKSLEHFERVADELKVLT